MVSKSTPPKPKACAKQNLEACPPMPVSVFALPDRAGEFMVSATDWQRMRGCQLELGVRATCAGCGTVVTYFEDSEDPDPEGPNIVKVLDPGCPLEAQEE
jgi:hypothetical protein